MTKHSVLMMTVAVAAAGAAAAAAAAAAVVVAALASQLAWAWLCVPSYQIAAEELVVEVGHLLLLLLQSLLDQTTHELHRRRG